MNYEGQRDLAAYPAAATGDLIPLLIGMATLLTIMAAAALSLDFCLACV